MKMFKSVFLLIVIPYIKAADPCQTAELKDADLRSSSNAFNPASTTTRFCDITLPEGWYRFQTNGVDADMPTTAPEFGSCNTLFPGYLDGTLPASTGTEITLDACIRNPVDVCAVRIPVKVKNCGTYNVYNLKPVQSCPTAYCFDTAQPCPDGQSSETGLQPGCSGNFPAFNSVPVVEPLLGTSLVNPLFEDMRFECRFPTIPSQFYDVVWFVNDVEVHRYTRLSATAIPQGGQLLESHWTQNFRMGMNVKCAVRVRESATSIPSPEHTSLVFFAGIKVLGDTAIELNEGEERIVKFKATVPIPCFSGLTICELELRVQKIGSDCSGDISECKINIKYSDWDAEHQFTVKGNYDGLYEDQVAQLILRASSNTPGLETVWDKLETAPIQVNIHDTDTQVAGSTCSIFNDPHFITFDKKRFDVHQHGEFILYKHKTLPYEVRGFFQKCSPGSSSLAHCVCGAAVRAGSQYFVWSKCKDNLTVGTFLTSRINVYGCTSRQLSVTTDSNKSIYKVKLPSGLEVTINTGSRSILITPSAADIGQTVGLCGNFNGNPDDEFIDPSGELFDNECELYLFGSPSVFCMKPTYSKTWKITDTTQSFYNGLAVNNLGPPLTAHCRCVDPVAGLISCENKPRAGCEAGLSPDDVTDQYCTQLNKRRRRRQVGNEALDEPIPVFPLEPDEPTPPFNGNNIWRNGWTEARAERHCRAVFSASKAVQACNNVRNLKTEMMIESCVADIALTGNSEWDTVTVDAHKVHCLAEAAKNTSLWKGNTGTGQTVLQDILSNSCPGECSGHGVCNGGICSCTNPWIGPDCGVDGSRVANVTELESGGLCDLSKEDCRQVLVRGGEFVDSDSLRCRFTQVRVSSNGLQLTRIVYITRAVFRHTSEVLCLLPKNTQVLSTQGYLVSISNNIINNFGPQKLFLPFHSVCHMCEIRGTLASCRLKANYCYINGVCTPSDQINTEGRSCGDEDEFWTRWYSGNDSISGDPTIQHYKGVDCPSYTRVSAFDVKRTTSNGTVIVGSGTGNFTVARDQQIEAGPLFGFRCRDIDQPNGVCLDYRARFRCKISRRRAA